MNRLSLPLNHTLSRPAKVRETSAQTLAAIFKILAIIVLFLVMGVGIQSPAGLRAVAATFIFLLLLLLLWRIPQWGAPLTFTFLVLLGGMRRWLIPDFGWLAFDPLILVSPLITLVTFFQLVVSSKVPGDTPLARSIKILLVIMALQVLNPDQGGLLVGFGGIVYYIAPLLWFYLGRCFGNNAVSLALFKCAVITFSLAAIYGMKQVFFGLSASEQSWVEIGGYTALNVSSNAIRVFSTFASTQEYAMVLSCAISLCATFVFHKKFQFLLPIIILFPALLYTATRGPVVFALFAICLQWALMGRSRAVWLPRLALALVLGIAGIVASVSSIDTKSLATGQADILRHQQQGLLNPEESTAPEHLLMVGNGVIYGIINPLGRGLGATTLAAGKLGEEGGDQIGSAETDYANLFISLGLGGIIYLVVIFFVCKQVLALWVKTRNITFLLLIGLLASAAGQWLSGGLYSLCFLVWFSIGIMDRAYATDPEISKTKEKIAPSSLLTRRRRNSIGKFRRVKSGPRRMPQSPSPSRSRL
jgi:hypothetical protein